MERDDVRQSIDVAANPFFAWIPNGQADRDGDDDEQTNRGKRRASAGAKTSPLEAVVYHHATTLEKDA